MATIITLVALPSIWLMSRDDPTGPATVTPAGVAVAPEPSSSGRPERVTALGSAGGAFLEAPEVELDRPRAAGDPIAIAVPAAPRGALAMSRATFRSTIPGEGTCLVADVPRNTSVTITNVDNGRTVTCVASLDPSTSSDPVVLHTDAYTRIADLSDAPVPVELTW